MAHAIFVQVLKEVLSRQFHATLDHIGQAPVFDADLVFNAAFTPELKEDLAALYLDMLVAQRGQAV